MLVKTNPRWRIPESEVTPKSLYANRRQIMKTMGIGGAIAATGLFPARRAHADLNYKAAGGPPEGDPLTSYEAVTTYNNFYEFGTDKDDPAEYAHRMPIYPWQVVIEGEVAKPQTLALDDFLNRADLEERIYRHRCVEAWSMVIPWIGFPLANLIREVEPTSRAKFIQFETLLDRKNMPGTRYPVLDWPYVEGLRIDEAMNPLAILAVGLYGENLPKQNGAPIRLVVPWKYGFKSIKSIVAIRFVEDQPGTSWSIATPNEYGFYSNVNPEVDHPRWSQKTERRIGEFRRRKTLKFNGYGEEVAYLYAGMDLKKYF